MSEEKNLLSEKTFESESESLPKHETKKFHFATMKENFRVQQFPFFLNDKKQELKLLITVVAANWQPEEHY